MERGNNFFNMKLRTSIKTGVAVGILSGLFCGMLRAQHNSPQDDFRAGSSSGKRIFTSNCAACHGLDGRGSDKAPAVAGRARVQNLSDEKLSRIVSNGVAGTGMPAFHSLKPEQVRAVVGYLRMLQGDSASRALPGSPDRGRKIFFGEAGCSSCHMSEGEGGFIGGDLTSYGAAKPAKAIRDAILSPSSGAAVRYKRAVVTTRDGTRLEGVLRNEDNFSLQLQDAEGAFHFLQKSDLQRFDYLDQPLMPTDYAERLKRNDLDDLVSYLMSAKGSGKVARPSAGERKE